MNKTPNIVALEARLDHLIKRLDEQRDEFLQSHSARYLIIITSGYFEQTVQTSLTQFARTRAGPELVNFVESALAREGSINRAKLERILRRFDKNWFEQLERRTNEPERNAVDSIKELRDRLAHGLDNGTGYAVAKAYHFLVRRYVEHLLEVVP